MKEDGTPNGYFAEQAQTYVRSFLDNDNLFSLDIVTANMSQIQHHLLSDGYTMYLEGWVNYFVNTNYFEAARN